MKTASDPVFGYVSGIFCAAFCAVILLVFHVKSGMKEQFITMDIGNFAVGLGTMAVAFVSVNSIKSNRAQKVADFQLAWIEELRQKTSELIEIYNIIGPYIVLPDEPVIPVGESAKFRRIQAHIAMMINPNSSEQCEIDLLSYVSLSPPDSVEEMNIRLANIITSSREVQKLAWRVAKQSVLRL